MNSVGVGHSHSQDGGDQLRVLVHGLGGPVGVGDNGEYGAHGDEGGLGMLAPESFFFRSCVGYKKRICIHNTNQTLSRYRLTQDGGDRPHVLVHGRRRPAVVGDQGEDGAHGEEDGLLRVVGPGINIFLSVFIHGVRRL